MKKKIAIISAVLVVTLALTALLVACNSYKWDSIGMGDGRAEVESNGGYAVKQGKYIYYINGFDGSDADNTWGVPVKQAILRSEVKEEGGKWVIDNKTTKVVVPKTVLYNSSVTDGGIAVFGDWIYYLTPNYDKDKNGVASTTKADFMRTRTDGALTQKIKTIDSRDVRYLFTPTRILYVTGTTLNYVDFSGMKTNKSIDNGKGATSGVLAENISGNVLWKMGHDTVYYVKTVTGANAYKNYNEICSIKIDGSDEKVIATEGTFLDEGEKPEDKVQKVFTYTLVDLLVENGEAVLYYTKSHTEGETKTDGSFCSKASSFRASEYSLSTTAVTSLWPIGYEKGALVSINSNLYMIKKDAVGIKDKLIVKGTPSVCYIDEGTSTVYYTTSSVTGLASCSFDLDAPDNQSIIFGEAIKTDWLKLDFIGSNLFFFATDDDNYMHFIDVKSPIYQLKDEDGEDLKTAYVGLEREEDSEEEAA